MRIYIDTIDAALTTQGRETGYRVDFHSELVSGTALLTATHSVSPVLRGQEIFVEVSSQSIRDVQTLLPGEPHHYSLAALPETGNYQAVGEVMYVSSEQGIDFAMVDVRVGDTLFHWTPDDNGQNIFALGDWVRFTVVGLALWDINL